MLTTNTVLPEEHSMQETLASNQLEIAAEVEIGNDSETESETDSESESERPRTDTESELDSEDEHYIIKTSEN